MAATLQPRTAPGERPTAHGHFRRDIEGLRAIAVGGVILFHCEVGPFGGGFAGVDVFFVISGFLITQVLLRDAAGDGISILRFYARRARRLLPAATLLIMAALAAALVMQPPITRAATAADARSAILFFSNFHFAHLATDYFNQGRAPSLFQHFWSLSVEEQFYFVWPTVLMVAMIGVRGEQRRKRLLAVAVAITAGSFAYAALRVGAEPTRTFFSPFARAWELGAGATLALAEPAMRRLGVSARQLLVTVGLGLIGVTFLAFDAGAGFPGWRALLPVIGTAAVIAGGVGGTTTVARVALEPWPMQFVGRFSYSLYLWHWPVIVLLAMRDDGSVASKKAVLAMALIALPAAWISYRLVEAPVRSGRMFADSRTAVTGAVILLVVSLVVATTYGAAAESLDAGVASKGFGPLDYVPSNIRPTLFDAYSHADTGWPCADDKPCAFGDLDSTRTVALVGDSHTRMWGAVYADIGERLRVRMLGLGADGCRSFGESHIGRARRNARRGASRCSIGLRQRSPRSSCSAIMPTTSSG